MSENSINEVNELLGKIKVTKENKEQVKEIRQCLVDRNFDMALELLKQIIPTDEPKTKTNKTPKKQVVEEEASEGAYPKILENPELEKIYIK